jgi:hypothetical protein
MTLTLDELSSLVNNRLGSTAAILTATSSWRYGEVKRKEANVGGRREGTLNW